jgi:hypothetical protein
MPVNPVPHLSPRPVSRAQGRVQLPDACWFRQDRRMQSADRLAWFAAGKRAAPCSSSRAAAHRRDDPVIARATPPRARVSRAGKRNPNHPHGGSHGIFRPWFGIEQATEQRNRIGGECGIARQQRLAAKASMKVDCGLHAQKRTVRSKGCLLKAILGRWGACK